MATITNETAVKLSQDWGVSFSDYKIGTEQVDFQDLMVKISENRAVAVESEVTPLTTRIRNRNKELEQLGSLLSIFSKAQADFKSDAGGGDTTTISGITSDMATMCKEACTRTGNGKSSTDTSWTKSQIEGMVSMLKSMIDERNNEAQTDMNRLQSLVDRRDESYTTATNLMSAVSDTRSNLISNL